MEIRASPMEKIIYWQIFVLAIIVSTLYGVTDEIHQLFVSGRQFSFFDMAFNFIGSSLILFKVWKK
jgi:VanZ family protein